MEERGGGSRARRGDLALAALGLAALLALHLGAWSPLPAGVCLGWIPAELLFRLAWMGLAWLYLVWFARAVWRDEVDPEERDAGEER